MEPWIIVLAGVARHCRPAHLTRDEMRRAHHIVHATHATRRDIDTNYYKVGGMEKRQGKNDNPNVLSKLENLKRRQAENIIGWTWMHSQFNLLILRFAVQDVELEDLWVCEGAERSSCGAHP